MWLLSIMIDMQFQFIKLLSYSLGDQLFSAFSSSRATFLWRHNNSHYSTLTSDTDLTQSSWHFVLLVIGQKLFLFIIVGTTSLITQNIGKQLWEKSAESIASGNLAQWQLGYLFCRRVFGSHGHFVYHISALPRPHFSFFNFQILWTENDTVQGLSAIVWHVACHFSLSVPLASFFLSLMVSNGSEIASWYQ